MKSITKNTIIRLIVGTAALGITGVCLNTYTHSIEDRLQNRQDNIIKNMSFNPLIRTADPQEFMRIYNAEEEAYDKGHGVMITQEDMDKFIERRNYWPYK